MSDFNIIIGANLVNAEAKIKNMIDEIGKDYPVKLKIVLQNKSELMEDISKIRKLLNNLEKLDINIGIGRISEEMNKFEDSTGKVGKKLTNNMKNASSEAEEYTGHMKETLSVYDRLIKVQQRMDREGNKTVTQKSGNDFVQTTQKFNARDMETPVVKEIVTDIKRLNDYVDKLSEKTNNWKHVVELMPNEIDELRNKMAMLNGLMKNDHIGFERELKNVQLLSRRLNELEINFASKFSGLEKARKIFQAEELGHVHDEKVTEQMSDLNKLDELARNKDIGEDKFGKRLQEWIAKQEKLVEENKNNLRTQKDLDKLTEKISKQIEEWKVNGHLAVEEINKFENGLRSLNVLSDGFNENLAKSKSEFIELSNREKQISTEKSNREKAVAKIEEQRISWQQKINDLERQGYTHKGQMNALQRRLNKLNQDDLKTLEQVNAHLRDMNAQYARATEYQKNTKLGISRTEKVESLRGKVDGNLDKDLIGQGEIDRIKGEIDKIFNTSSVEQLEKAVRKVVKIYGELINKQKEAIDLKKLEVIQEQEREKIHQHLSDMEKKTIQEQTRLANEENDRRAREWEENRKLAEQMGEGRESTKSKREREERNKEAKEAVKEANKINEEQVRIWENQQRINQEYKEFDRIMDEIRKNEFIKESDLEKAKDMIGQISNESKTLSKDLNAIHSELSKIGKQGVKRQGDQERVDVLNRQNQIKADDILGRNIVPENIVNNFKQLSDSLSFESSKKDIEEVRQELAKILKLEQELKSESKESERYKKLILQAEQNLVKVTDKYADKLDEVRHNARRQLDDSSRLSEVEREVGKALDMVNEHRERGVQLTYDQQREIQRQIKDIGRLVQSHKDLEAQLNREAKKAQELADRFDSLAYRTDRAIKDASTRQGREVVEDRDSIRNRVENIRNLSGAEFEAESRAIQEEMTKLSQKAREVKDRVTESRSSIFGRFSHAMQQVPIWISAMTIFYGTMAQVRQGFESLLDIDEAMINLQKVTDATKTELEEFMETAHEIGHTLGVVTSDVISATTEFQKLGYTLQEASMLGQNSILYANVGDMSVEEATQNIISSVKGFGIEIDRSGSNVRNIVDIFNEVSNNFAITSAGIGEALRRSSAMLNDAGNTVEQSVALVTAANTTIQDPRKVGNALKTVSMRLRGVDEDGQKVATLVPELERVFNSFGASIMEDENTFKSTYDIFDDLSEKWEELTDIQRAYITELIGGKEQGSIVASMIGNWSDAVESHETALTSAGSAQREFQEYMDGFQYKIGQLKVALEEFWTTLINDDAMKGFIDFLTLTIQSVTNIVDLLGGGVIATNLAGLFGIFAFTGLRHTVFDPDEWDNIKKQIFNVGEEFQTTGGKAQNSIRGIGRALVFTLGRLTLITGGLTLLTIAVQKSYDWIMREEIARKERIKTLEDEIKQYERLQDTLSGMNMDEYYRLDSKRNTEGLNQEEYAIYSELQQQIIDNMPELISYYDEHGKAVLRDAESIRQLIAEKERMYYQDKQEVFELNVEDADLDKLQDKISDVADIMKSSRNSVEEEEAYNFAKAWIEKNIEGVDLNSKELREKVEELREGFSSMFSEDNESSRIAENIFSNQVLSRLDRGNIDRALQFIDEQSEAIRSRTSKLNSEISRAKNGINSHIEEFGVLLEDGFEVHMYDRGIDSSSNEFKFITDLKEQLLEDITQFGEEDLKEDILGRIPEFIDEALEALRSSEVDVTDLFKPSADINKINEDFNRVASSIDINTNNGQSLLTVLERLRTQQINTARSMASNPIEPFTFASDVMPLVSEYMNNVSSLESAYKSLNEGNALTIQQTFDLIEKYPQLSKELTKHDGAVRVSKKAIMELAEVKESEFKTDLRQKKEQAESAMENAKKNVEAILIKAKAIQTLEEINSKLLKTELDRSKEDLRKTEAYLNIANQIGAYDVAGRFMAERNALSENTKVLEENYKIVADMEGEIAKIDALLNMNFSGNLGSVGSTAKESSKQLSDAIYVADKYKQTMDEINNAISILQMRQENLAKQSDKYRVSLREELDLTQQKKKAIDDEIRSLQNQIKTQQIQRTGLIQMGKEDNKTARARQAELQQEIDKLKENLQSLQVEAEQVMNRLKQLSFEVIQSNLELYNIQREMLSDDIAYTEYAMNLYREGSKSYMQYANTRIEYMKKIQDFHQQELAYLELEKKTNQDLTDEQIMQLNERIRESRKAVYESNESVRELQQSLNEIKIDNATDQFNREADKYANAIRDIRDKLKYDVNEDFDYAKKIGYLQDILALNKGQLADAHRNISSLKAMKEEYRGNHELVSKISSEIDNWEDKIYDTTSQIKSLEKEIENAYRELADEFVDIYKKQMELMKKAEDERYKNMMDRERKSHNQRMKHLDDELAKLREVYNNKMKLIDREESARAFENDIERMREESKEIQRQIDILSLDDSYESKAKKSELVKKLAEINLNISERQYDREIELRRKNLNDDLEAQEKSLTSKKDKYQEDYDKFVEIEEKKKEDREKYWEQQMNDEAKFASIREEIMNGNLNNMLSMVQGWSADVTSEMGILGQTITNNFTMRVEEAIKSLRELKSMNIGSMRQAINVGAKDLNADPNPIPDIRDHGSVGNQSNPEEQSKNTGGIKPTNPSPPIPTTPPIQPEKPKQNPEPPKPNNRYHTVKSGDTMGHLAIKYYKDYNKWSKIRDANPSVHPNRMQIGTKLLIPFKTGGYTGDWSGDNGRLAVLHKKELVLNKQQTSDILNTAKVVEKLKSALPKLDISSNIQSIQKSEPQIQSIKNEYNINVEVENMNGDKKSADIVAEQIINKIKRNKGGRF